MNSTKLFYATTLLWALFVGGFFAYMISDPSPLAADPFNRVDVDPETGARAPGGPPAPPAPPAPAAAEPEAAADEPTDPEAGTADEVEDIVDEILGEEDLGEEDLGEEAAEGDDFIDEIMGDDGEAPVEAEAEPEAAVAPTPAPE